MGGGQGARGAVVVVGGNKCYSRAYLCCLLQLVLAKVPGVLHEAAAMKLGGVGVGVYVYAQGCLQPRQHGSEGRRGSSNTHSSPLLIYILL